MPNITLEQTSNLQHLWQPKEFMQTVHEIIVSHVDAGIAHCKSRIVTHDEFFVGDGNQTQAFVALTVNLLSGRPGTAKTALANHLLKELTSRLNNVIPNETVAISCYVNDIAREFYVKSN